MLFLNISKKKLFFDTVTDIDKVTKPMELVPMPAPNLIKKNIFLIRFDGEGSLKKYCDFLFG